MCDLDDDAEVTTPGGELRAQSFEANRSRLHSIAYRMLGSDAEADDAVQETWLRLTRTGPDEVGNPGAWLRTVVARVCLDMLRARKSRREEAWEPDSDVFEARAGQAMDPEREAVLADSVGVALFVVLDRLAPAERVAFVLHDMFELPFEEIAVVLERSPAAARQLASRARRRLRGATLDQPSGGASHRRIVDAFLAASRRGDMQALIRLLAPDVVLRADSVAVRTGAAERVSGAQDVARTFAGRARVARPATIDGAPGAVWLQAGTPRVVFAFTFAGDVISGIELVADPGRIERMKLVVGARPARA